MIALVAQGGVLLIPILLLSLVAVYVIVERSLYYWSVREADRELTTSVVATLQKRSAKQLFNELQDRRSPEAKVVMAGLRSGKRLAQPEHRLRLDYVVLKEINALERHVPYLQSIANVATLLGLLGTVLGMIGSFVNMRASGGADLEVLAGGISQALVTTAAELAVAIPSTLFHHVFANHVQRATDRLSIMVSEMTAFFSSSR